MTEQVFTAASAHNVAVPGRMRVRDSQRQTYHVERRYIELIKHEAEMEGVSITEVVNRALRMYFERR